MTVFSWDTVGRKADGTYVLPPAPRVRAYRPRRIRPGWIRLSDPRSSKVCQVFQHLETGHIVRHCGHPTALWPWSIEFWETHFERGGSRKRLETFQHLADAMASAESFACLCCPHIKRGAR